MIRFWWSSRNLDQDLEQVLERIEELRRKVDNMPTRADLDAAKQALSTEITNVVNHINQLEQQLQQGQPITDQDIQDLKADLAQLQGTDQQPAPPPPPNAAH